MMTATQPCILTPADLQWVPHITVVSGTYSPFVDIETVTLEVAITEGQDRVFVSSEAILGREDVSPALPSRASVAGALSKFRRIASSIGLGDSRGDVYEGLLAELDELELTRQKATTIAIG